MLRPNRLSPCSSHSTQTAHKDGREVGDCEVKLLMDSKSLSFFGFALEFSGNEIRGGEDKGPYVIAADMEGRFFNSRFFICKPTTSYCKDQNILRVGCLGEENSP